MHLPQSSAVQDVNPECPGRVVGPSWVLAVPTPRPCPAAKSRSIALPMDLDAHVSSLLNSSSTSTVQRNTSSYKAATRTFPRVSTTPNQWDYKNIIEKLQVQGRAWRGSGGRRVLVWQGPSAVCPLALKGVLWLAGHHQRPGGSPEAAGGGGAVRAGGCPAPAGAALHGGDGGVPALRERGVPVQVRLVWGAGKGLGSSPCVPAAWRGAGVVPSGIPLGCDNGFAVPGWCSTPRTSWRPRRSCASRC